MIPLIITETETDKIDEATNGLQFSNFFFIKVIVLFCRILSVSMSHSSSTINAAAFLNSHLQLTTFQKEPFSHSLISKHFHLHFSLFHFCLLLQTFSSNKQPHLQLL